MTPQPSKCCELGHKISDYPHGGCPLCSAPVCCETCCRAENLHEESPDDEFILPPYSADPKNPIKHVYQNEGYARGFEEGAASMRNKVQYSLGFEEGRKKGRGNIGALRQWINERTETRLITNEDIVTFLDL